MAFALVFPGQGSQAVGMMAAYGDSAVVRATFDEASAALDQDLWQLLAEGPAEALAQTVNTQPVMLSAGVAVYRLWLDMGGKLPTVVAGHSLGEYTALVVAGVIAFKDAVPLVRLRAAAMQEAVPAGAGAMAAILGLDDDKIAEACAEARAAGSAAEVVEPVNYNGPGQTVIAGSKAAVERACAECKARGAKRALLLPVSAPFHSSLMRPAAAKLATRLAELNFAAAADAGDQQCRCGDRVGSRPDQGRSGSAGVLTGALGRDDPENGRHGHHDGRRMRTWQGSGRPQQALCRPVDEYRTG
jgi:[acyl-carrier-protein] S-malonyltransferase